jgi:two-component system sensor histidine kinase DesK
MAVMHSSEDPRPGIGAREAEEAEQSRPLTPRGILRACRESGALPFALPPSVFVLIPMAYSWLNVPWPVALLASIVLIAYALVFVASTGIALYPQRVRLGWFALGTVLMLVMIPLLGVGVLYMVMFQAMSHVLLLPWKRAVPSMVAMSIAVMILAVVFEQYVAAGLAVMGTVMAWGIGHGIRQQLLQEQLEAAQQRNAVLAVAAERERIGRDLHDLLGHSLTSLTISAQLARRLLDTDPEAARAQLEHIESTVRQALADVRATASGMQHVRAATEIASARTVLATVGIQAQVPTALPPLHEDLSELFGYVIREGVTNIVRHSGATAATIAVTAHSVTISDDGAGIPARAALSGLRGLEARIAVAGGRFEIDSDERGTRLHAAMTAQDTAAQEISS